MRIVERYHLREVEAPSGGPLLPVIAAMNGQPVGAARVFTGAPLLKVVTISIAVPAFGLDSHMVFAFTPPDSAVPHFTVDSVFGGGSFAYHLDLVPRVDIGENLAYIDSALTPLTEAWTAARAISGVSPAKLLPRQLALMSPWLLAFRADEAAFRQLTAPTNAYLDHWFGLVDKGLPQAALEGQTPAALARRDQRNKDALFNPDVDPVWHQIARLTGEPLAAKLRELLRRGEA
jgi:hypothetical protein